MLSLRLALAVVLALSFLRPATARACDTTARLLWLLSTDGHLWTVHPTRKTLDDAGKPKCRVDTRSKPVALALTHESSLWVAYSGGELAEVNPKTLECRVAQSFVPGIEQLVVRPPQDGGDLLALIVRDTERVLARLEPTTGTLSSEVALEGPGPLAFNLSGALWQVSPGVVPELWQLTTDGRIESRRAAPELSGETHTLAFVGDSAWVGAGHLAPGTAQRFMSLAPAAKSPELAFASTDHTFIASASVPSCSAPLQARCESTASIASPKDGAVLAGWKPFDIEVAGADATHVRVDGPGLSKLLPVTDVKGKRTAKLSLSSSDRIAPLQLFPADENGAPCGPPISAQRSKLAVLAEVNFPVECTTSAPCPLEATLVRAEADDVTRTFLDSPRLQAKALLREHDAIPLQRDEDGVWRGVWANVAAGVHEAVVRWEAVGIAVERAASLEVNAPPAIVTPETLDLGTIRPGTHWQQTCRTLSVQTTGLVNDELVITAQTPGGCIGSPVSSLTGVALSLAEGLRLPATPRLTLPVCLDSVACGGDEVRNARLLLTVPRTGTTREVALTWALEGSDDWACHKPLAWGLAGGLVFLLTLVGFFTPKRFPKTLKVRMAGRREDLSQAEAVAVRSLRGGRAAWYRNARLLFDSSGNALRANAHDAVLVVESDRAEGALIRPGLMPLRRFNPKTHRLDPLGEGEAVEAGAVYEAGGLWVTFE